jgi:hypothetical protein
MAGGIEFDDIARLRAISRAWHLLRADNAPLVRTCDLKPARLTSPLTITFRDGGSWLLEVARLNLNGGKRLAAAVSSQSQSGQRIPRPVGDS